MAGKRVLPHHSVIQCDVLPTRCRFRKVTKSLISQICTSRLQGLLSRPSWSSNLRTSLRWFSSRQFGIFHSLTSYTCSIYTFFDCRPPLLWCTALLLGPYRRRKQQQALLDQGLELSQKFEIDPASPNRAVRKTWRVQFLLIHCSF